MIDDDRPRERQDDNNKVVEAIVRLKASQEKYIVIVIEWIETLNSLLHRDDGHFYYKNNYQEIYC